VFTKILFLALFFQAPTLPPLHPPIEPDTIFIPLNEDIPKEVTQTQEQSMVIIQATMPILSEDHRLHVQPRFTEGFVVWPGYVLTTLHLAGGYPALWGGNSNFPTAFTIADGKALFEASLVDYNYKADLALLQVHSPNGWAVEFSKKPLKIVESIAPPSGDASLITPLPAKLFAFAYYSTDPHLFFAASIGPLRAITNSFDGGRITDIPFALVQGTIQPGFSGGPLLAPDGTAVGMVQGIIGIYTTVILPETMHTFLSSARVKLGLDKN